jgi:hypothetical protein
VKGDSRLLSENLDRPDIADRGHHRIEERADFGRLSREVVLEIVPAAGVRLVAIRELATAPLAPPQRRRVQCTTLEWSMRR